MNILLEKIFKLNRIKKIIIQIITDIILITFCFILSITIRLNNFKFINQLDYWKILLIVVFTTIFVYLTFGFYKAIIRYISEKIFLSVGIAVFFSSITLYVSSMFFDAFIPRSVPFIYFTFLFLSTAGIRFIFKNIYLIYKFDKRKPIAIYGAGNTGRQISDYLNESLEYKPIFFIDDNKKLFKTKINELNVYNVNNFENHALKNNIKTIILAMPNLSLKNRQIIIKKLENKNLEVKTVSDNNSLFFSKKKSFDISNLSIQEIIGRQEIPPLNELLLENILGKNVLITGAGGSIGKELTRQIAKLCPNKLICLENSEHNLYKIQEEFYEQISEKNTKLNLIPVLGSIQDLTFLESLFKQNKINTIFHAAAYKHVPLIEDNIIEGIKNNIFGTYNICNLSVKHNVENMILISSDKAVRPTNIMGVTKRISELICQAKSKTYDTTKFSIVRFGNVIGSSGSVIPKFNKQILKGGPVSVTDRKIIRYFMTIKEAAGLVIQASTLGKNGQIFVLDMGKPINIFSLAKKMIKLYGFESTTNQNSNNDNHKILIKFTGLRKGEKMYEELFLNKKIYKTKHPRIFKANENDFSNAILEKFLIKLNKLIMDRNLKSIKMHLNSLSEEFKIN